MARMPRGREAAARLAFAAALTLAGAGAGAAAVLAANGSGLIRTADGGVAGLCSAAWADSAKQRRQAATAAREERARALGPVVATRCMTAAPKGSCCPPGTEPPRSGPGRAADLTWLQAWHNNPDALPAALVTGPAGPARPGSPHPRRGA